MPGFSKYCLLDRAVLITNRACKFCSIRLKSFTISFLDRINGSTFEWTKMRRCGSQECLVTFNSQMISSFEMPRSTQIFPHSETYLIETPIILGGFFMIHRKRFVKLGGFDNELRIWGGENIDISCGFSNSC